MKLTTRQRQEKECLEWFSPSLFRKWFPQEGEFEEYLNHSERGIPIRGFLHDSYTFNVYTEAKRWRGITVHELWEDSFDEVWTGFYELLTEEDNITPIPEHIMKFISREIFAGQDRELIEDVYKKICTTAENQ